MKRKIIKFSFVFICVLMILSKLDLRTSANSDVNSIIINEGETLPENFFDLEDYTIYSNNVNINQSGTYEIKYLKNDSDLNNPIFKNRTVYVLKKDYSKMDESEVIIKNDLTISDAWIERIKENQYYLILQKKNDLNVPILEIEYYQDNLLMWKDELYNSQYVDSFVNQEGQEKNNLSLLIKMTDNIKYYQVDNLKNQTFSSLDYNQIHSMEYISENNGIYMMDNENIYEYKKSEFLFIRSVSLKDLYNNSLFKNQLNLDFNDLLFCTSFYQENKFTYFYRIKNQIIVFVLNQKLYLEEVNLLEKNDYAFFYFLEEGFFLNYELQNNLEVNQESGIFAYDYCYYNDANHNIMHHYNQMEFDLNIKEVFITHFNTEFLMNIVLRDGKNYYYNINQKSFHKIEEINEIYHNQTIVQKKYNEVLIKEPNILEVYYCKDTISIKDSQIGDKNIALLDRTIPILIYNGRIMEIDYDTSYQNFGNYENTITSREEIQNKFNVRLEYEYYVHPFCNLEQNQIYQSGTILYVLGEALLNEEEIEAYKLDSGGYLLETPGIYYLTIIGNKEMNYLTFTIEDLNLKTIDFNEMKESKNEKEISSKIATKETRKNEKEEGNKQDLEEINITHNETKKMNPYFYILMCGILSIMAIVVTFIIINPKNNNRRES